MTNNSNQQNCQRNTVNRTLNLDNANDYYDDQQTNAHLNTYSNQQNRIPAPISTNLRPLESPSQTPVGWVGEVGEGG
jgi:hypothetical protein